MERKIKIENAASFFRNEQNQLMIVLSSSILALAALVALDDNSNQNLVPSESPMKHLRPIDTMNKPTETPHPTITPIPTIHAPGVVPPPIQTTPIFPNDFSDKNSSRV